MATKYTQESLLRHSAKELFFKSCILFLTIDDDVGMEKMLSNACDRDPFFMSSYEKRFLEAILKSYQNNDLTLFADEV
jgi:alpha-soluble NSF attachment protein